MLETLYNHLSDTPGELRQPWIFETTTQLAKLLVVNKWDIFIFCITTSFPWFKSFKWTNLLSLLFCRSFDEDFLWFPDKKQPTNRWSCASYLTFPCCSCAANCASSVVKVTAMFPSGPWLVGFSPSLSPQNMRSLSNLDSMIPFHFSPVPFPLVKIFIFKNRWKKLPTHRCLQFFRKLPASQVAKCHSTYISWVTRVWPEILVSPSTEIGRFWPIFLVAKMGRILWNPMEHHDLFKPQRSISGGFLAKSPLILLRCEISCEWSWSWVFDPTEKHRNVTRNGTRNLRKIRGHPTNRRNC